MNIYDLRKKKHFHTGLLILVVLTIFLVYKVDIETTVQSEGFKQDVTIAKVTTESAWQKYVVNTWNYIWYQIIHPTNKTIIIPNPADEKQIEQTVQPAKVRTYFGNTQEETVQQITDPSKKW